MIWLKILHLAAIAIWSAGLVALPALYLRRARVTGEALHRLQALVRFLYVAALSPAAFIAIASGTALIFLREPYAPWFSLKLTLVGVLTTIHILAGHVILRLFKSGGSYPAWRAVTATTLTVVVVASILVVVLAKPRLPDALPAAMSEPGALNPFRR